MRSTLYALLAIAALVLTPTALAQGEPPAHAEEDSRPQHADHDNSPTLAMGPPDPGSGCRPTC